MDRFGYNQAAAQSSNEQLLLNLVRLRHGEPILFLEIGSMLSQYSLSADANVNWWDNDLNVWSNPALRAYFGVDGDPGKQNGRGGSIGYSDRPTITYSPLNGEAFARRLMTPIAPSTLLLLTQAGLRLDHILETCVQQLNGLHNLPLHTDPNPNAPDASKFYEATQLVRDLHGSGSVDAELAVDAATGDPALRILPVAASHAGEAHRLRELLGFQPNDAGKFRVIRTVRGGSPDDLVVRTRSLLGIMNSLAAHIGESTSKYPASAPAAGPARVPDPAWLTVTRGLAPSLDAFVQVPYHGYWWSIARGDLRSKRTLALVSYLYLIQASESSAGHPVIAVPAGR